MTQTEAFDLISDKVCQSEPFDASLVAASSDGTVLGFLKVESWLSKKGYKARTFQGRLVYELHS